MNPTDDDLSQITAGSTSLADIRRRAFEAGWDAGHTHGRSATLGWEAFQGKMEVGTEFALHLGGGSATPGRIIPLEFDVDYYDEHPEEALPHIVLSRRVYRDPWEKHVYYPPVPMA